METEAFDVLMVSSSCADGFFFHYWSVQLVSALTVNHAEVAATDPKRAIGQIRYHDVSVNVWSN